MTIELLTGVDAMADPATSALIVVGGAADDTPTASTRALLQAARAARVLTVFVEPLEVEWASWPADLTPEPGVHEFIVRAPEVAPLHASTLAVLLRANGVKTAVVTATAPGFRAEILLRDARARGLQGLDAQGEAVQVRVAARWTRQLEGARGWQPEVQQARWLRSLEERVHPARAALVLIDVQNDFVSPDGASGRREAMPLVTQAMTRLPQLLAAARATGCCIVHVQAEYGQHVRGVGSPYRFPSSRTREGAVWSLSATEIDERHQFPAGEVEVCLPRSWGREVIDAARPRPGEIQLTKHRFSAFINTPLEVMLRARGIETLIVAGVTTNCCIESTVRDASMLDFHVVVAEDAVGVKNSVIALHEASLEQMRTYFALVEPVSRIVDAMLSHLPEELPA